MSRRGTPAPRPPSRHARCGRREKKQDDAEAESLRKVQRAGVTAAPAAVAAAARAVYKDPWGPQGSYRAAARHQNSGVFPMEAREVTAMISGCR